MKTKVISFVALFIFGAFALLAGNKTDKVKVYGTIFCPMAFDSIGAYWISDSKTVQNPYMGSKMPICGDVKEEL